jgi:hypothetical protein
VGQQADEQEGANCERDDVLSRGVERPGGEAKGNHDDGSDEFDGE